MMLRSAVIFFLLFFTTTFSVAQFVVTGIITDSGTGEPLHGVYVIYGTNQGTTTDVDGKFSFITSNGNITIKYQYIGYQSLTKEYQTLLNDTLNLTEELHMELREIGQIVVSAGRTEQRIAEVTVSLSLIKSEDFTGSHITDPQELMNKTPGIEVLDGQASIRGGSGFSYGVGSRVLALVDGLPMMSADGGNIKWSFLPFENISQIEIIKGASSVLYGSSALNGVVNFRTSDASNIPETKFYVETGIYGKPKNKDWAWWSTPRLFNSAGFSHLRKKGNNDFGIGINLMADNGYRKYNDEKLGRLNLKMKHFSNKIEGLNYGANISAGVTNKTDFVLWDNAATGALMQDTSSVSELNGIFLSVDPFLSLKTRKNITHDIRTRIQYSENKFPVRYRNDASSTYYYGEYQFRGEITDFLNITSGISTYYSIIESKFFGDHKGSNFAGYTQFELMPIKRLKLVAGVRLEQNALDGIKDKLVPVFRTGINYQAAEYTFLRASFGQGYRYPSIAEKHASTTLGSVKIYPNPSVEPESGWSAEAGVKQGLVLGVLKGEADLALFYSQNINMIEYLFAIFEDPPGSGIFGPPGFQATNVEQSRIYGTEVSLIVGGNIRNLLVTCAAGYSFIYPVEYNRYTGENKDIFLKYRRKHSGSLAINAGYKKVSAGLNIYGKSKLLNIDDVFVNPASREQILPGFFGYWTDNNRGYLTADVSASYKLSVNYNISFVVKNLTNTEYMGRPGDIQPHRNFSLRFSGNFGVVN